MQAILLCPFFIKYSLASKAPLYSFVDTKGNSMFSKKRSIKTNGMPFFFTETKCLYSMPVGATIMPSAIQFCNSAMERFFVFTSSPLLQRRMLYPFFLHFFSTSKAMVENHGLEISGTTKPMVDDLFNRKLLAILLGT